MDPESTQKHATTGEPNNVDVLGVCSKRSKLSRRLLDARGRRAAQDRT